MYTIRRAINIQINDKQQLKIKYAGTYGYKQKKKCLMKYEYWFGIDILTVVYYYDVDIYPVCIHIIQYAIIRFIFNGFNGTCRHEVRCTSL